MSARAKTSERQICEAARRLLEARTERGVSMQAVAKEVGIRAPSLYKRFASKDDLLSTAALGALGELAEILRDASRMSTPRESLERTAHSYRKFAKSNPRTYGLIFAGNPALSEDLAVARQKVAEPLWDLLTKELEKNEAQRGTVLLLSFLHGFLSMELSKAFRSGWNAGEAFQYGLTKQLDSLLGPNGMNGKKD